jgi:hypothetical protein
MDLSVHMRALSMVVIQVAVWLLRTVRLPATHHSL